MGGPVFLPINPKVHSLLLANSAVLGLALFVVALRIFARVHFAAGLGLDDYCILVSMPMALAMLVISYHFGRLWLGHHLWDIPKSNFQLTSRLFLAYELLYIGTVGLNKLSILLFYLRVFIQPWIRQWCKIFMVLLAMGEVAMTLQPALVCRPAKTVSGESADSKCIDLHTGTILMAVWAMATDLAVLTLPIPALMALQVSRRRKVGLIVVFLTGLFATVVATSRVYTLVAVYKPEGDTSYTSIWPDFLAVLEPNVTIICISLPMLGPIVKCCVHKARGQSNSDYACGQELSAYGGRKTPGIATVGLCRKGGCRTDARSESGSETALAPPPAD